MKEYETKDLIDVGILWLGLTLAFEWLGGFALGRPVEEISVGWNVFGGYMWPYVLLTICCQTSSSVQFSILAKSEQ